MCRPERHVESFSRERDSWFNPSFNNSQSIHPKSCHFNQGSVGWDGSSWDGPRPSSSSGRDDSGHHKNHSKNNRKTFSSILFTWTKTATGCHWSQELSGCYTRFGGNCCRSPVTKNHNYTVWSTSLENTYLKWIWHIDPISCFSSSYISRDDPEFWLDERVELDPFFESFLRLLIDFLFAWDAANNF